MKQWEHLSVHALIEGSATIPLLDSYGAKGWELVAVVADRGGMGNYFLKRQVWKHDTEVQPEPYPEKKAGR